MHARCTQGARKVDATQKTITESGRQRQRTDQPSVSSVAYARMKTFTHRTVNEVDVRPANPRKVGSTQMQRVRYLRADINNAVDHTRV
jgi:hypothetical protein